MSTARWQSGRLWLLVVLAALFWPMAGLAAPKVLVSIKPIHALVAGVMAGVARPALLLSGTTSPHSYSLRPSDAAKLQTAEIIFWLGADLEAFLASPLRNLARKAAKHALIEAPGLQLLRAKNDAPSGGATDMHIWLDPVNAKHLVGHMARILSQADPANGTKYNANAAVLKTRLDTLTRTIEKQLAPYLSRPFMVFHNAFGYFQQRFRLRPAAVIAHNPHRRPSAARLKALRKILRASDIRCVFREPQFNAALVAILTEGSSAKIASLDPLGSAIPPGPEQYFTLLANLSETFRKCLAY